MERDELLIWENRERQKYLCGFEPVFVFTQWEDLVPSLKTATVATLIERAKSSWGACTCYWPQVKGGTPSRSKFCHIHGGF